MTALTTGGALQFMGGFLFGACLIMLGLIAWDRFHG